MTAKKIDSHKTTNFKLFIEVRTKQRISKTYKNYMFVHFFLYRKGREFLKTVKRRRCQLKRSNRLYQKKKRERK